MNAEKALELVGRYARLTHAIRECKKRIGAELDKCQGLKGHRLEVETVACSWMHVAVGDPTKAAQDDQDTHLSLWYAGDIDDDGRRVWPDPRDFDDECPACYAAHLIVQERKGLRRQLGAVKAAMTRLGDARRREEQGEPA